MTSGVYGRSGNYNKAHLNGGGEPLAVGTRIKLIGILPLMEAKMTKAEIKHAFTERALGTVIELDREKVPTIRMDNGALFRGGSIRWRRV